MTKPSDGLERTLMAALNVTLENMAFEQAFLHKPESPDDVVKPDETWLWSRLDVSSPVPGHMFILVQRPCAEQITENILGPDPEENGETISDPMPFDAMAELINTVAGRFMQRLSEDGSDFSIGLPETGIGQCCDQDDDKTTKVTFQIASMYHLIIGVQGDDLIALSMNRG
jgi:CheY-specific phosphatase CheX